MKWNELYPSSVPPLPSDIDKFVSSPLWSEFCTSVEGTYGVSPRVEYSKCSMAPGWNVKYKRAADRYVPYIPITAASTVCWLSGIRNCPAPNLSSTRADHIYRSFSEYKPVPRRQVAVYRRNKRCNSSGYAQADSP